MVSLRIEDHEVRGVRRSDRCCSKERDGARSRGKDKTRSRDAESELKCEVKGSRSPVQPSPRLGRRSFLFVVVVFGLANLGRYDLL